MTAFDNIKVNNWPAASNELEDFLVFKQPLNDSASLTESLPVEVGSKTLLPKRTLTNTSVVSEDAGLIYSTAGTQTGSDYGAGAEISGAFRKNYLLYTASGEGAFAAGNTSLRYTFPTPITVTDNVKIYFWRNGGSIKVNAGESDEQTDNSSSGYTTWTIPASSVGVLKNVELYTDGNTGPYWSGILVDDVQLYDAPAGSKKYYDNAAVFNGSSAFLYHEPDPLFNLGTDDWAIECWFKKDSLSSTGQLFQLGLEVYYTNNIEIAVNTNGAIQYHMYGNSTNTEGFTSSNSAITAGTWHHMACTRQGTTFRGFLDGVQLGSWTKAANWNVGSSTAAHNSPTIGARTNGSRAAMHNYFDGVIQDFRIYRGTAKYTANFTPPGAILG